MGSPPGSSTNRTKRISVLPGVGQNAEDVNRVGTGVFQQHPTSLCSLLLLLFSDLDSTTLFSICLFFTVLVFSLASHSVLYSIQLSLLPLFLLTEESSQRKESWRNEQKRVEEWERELGVGCCWNTPDPSRLTTQHPVDIRHKNSYDLQRRHEQLRKKGFAETVIHSFIFTPFNRRWSIFGTTEKSPTKSYILITRRKWLRTMTSVPSRCDEKLESNYNPS